MQKTPPRWGGDLGICHRSTRTGPASVHAAQDLPCAAETLPPSYWNVRDQVSDRVLPEVETEEIMTRQPVTRIPWAHRLFRPHSRRLYPHHNPELV